MNKKMGMYIACAIVHICAMQCAEEQSVPVSRPVALLADLESGIAILGTHVESPAAAAPVGEAKGEAAAAPAAAGEDQVKQEYEKLFQEIETKLKGFLQSDAGKQAQEIIRWSNRQENVTSDLQNVILKFKKIRQQVVLQAFPPTEAEKTNIQKALKPLYFHVQNSLLRNQVGIQNAQKNLKKCWSDFLSTLPSVQLQTHAYHARNRDRFVQLWKEHLPEAQLQKWAESNSLLLPDDLVQFIEKIERKAEPAGRDHELLFYELKEDWWKTK